MSARRLLAYLLAVGGAANVSCTRETELIDDGSIPGLLSIEITPADSIVVIDDLQSMASVSFVAIGHFVDGESRDITADLDWGVVRRVVGEFGEPGLWRASNRAGGLVRARAEAGSVRQDVEIAVHFEPTLRDPSFPPPAMAEALFTSDVPVVVADADNSPSVVYPSNGTLFPINVFRTLFQFELGAVVDLVQIRFVGDYLDLKVLTTNDRWQAESASWEHLAQSAVGDRAEMTVSGVSLLDPSTIWQSAPVSLRFSESAVGGAIYYWSDSSEGVLKATLNDPSPTRFYAETPDDKCVGCHTISRDGKRLAVGYDGETLQEVSVPERETIVDASEGLAMGFSTFSPDSQFLLLADRGRLQLIDAESGEPVGPDGGAIDIGGAKATHPDWSPLGNFVALAVCEGAGNNRDVDKCSIARVPVTGGTNFGDVELLVPAGGGADNNFFPRYSPDGEWIAYANADGKSRGQKKAEIRIVRAGGGTPIALTAASSRVGPLNNVAETGSTMPTWAPTTEPGIKWLAFSSTRDYGKVLVGGMASQLWVVGLDMNVAARSEDPSFAAFWLPAQDPSQRNHRPFWAVDSDIVCASEIEICDGLDNDCDGIVDNECADCAAEEVCFDGADNDCNGLVDDGCIQ